MSIIGVFVAKHIPSRAIGKISLKNKNKIKKYTYFRVSGFSAAKILNEIAPLWLVSVKSMAENIVQQLVLSHELGGVISL